MIYSKTIDLVGQLKQNNVINLKLAIYSRPSNNSVLTILSLFHLFEVQMTQVLITSMDLMAHLIQVTQNKQKYQNKQKQIGALIQEIEKQNISIKLKTQQIQECHSKISQMELHYGLKIEDLEAQHLYQIQLTQSQVYEQQQENSNLINEINQLKWQQNQYNLLVEQTNTENKQLREQIIKFQFLNSIQTGDMNDDPNSNQQKQETIQIKQHTIKLNEVIQSFEEQNKNYEEEYSKQFKENHHLKNLKNILTQQLETLKIENLQLQEENTALLDQMNRTKEQFNISQEQIKYQLKQEQIEKQQLQNQFQLKVCELQTVSSQLESIIQETQQGSSQLNQFSWKISSLEQQEHDLQNLIEHQKTQITQQRKTINLLEQNLLNSQNTEIQYQQLLQNYNNIKEQLYQSSISEHNGTNNQQLIQQQLLTSQKQCQEQQIKIEKLTVMLKNRLNEIELWKNKCYENNSYENRQQFEQIKQENEILRQKCNMLEINIKENKSPIYSQEIIKLNQIIKQQQDRIIDQQQLLELKKKQLGSPKSQKAFTTEMNTKEFNSKSKRN